MLARSFAVCTFRNLIVVLSVDLPWNFQYRESSFCNALVLNKWSFQSIESLSCKALACNTAYSVIQALSQFVGFLVDLRRSFQYFSTLSIASDRPFAVIMVLLFTVITELLMTVLRKLSAGHVWIKLILIGIFSTSSH